MGIVTTYDAGLLPPWATWVTPVIVLIVIVIMSSRVTAAHGRAELRWSWTY